MVTNTKAPIEIMRQVQIITGLMILIVIVSPYFIIITTFVGLGLLTAGVTGFCGMANLLMILPYNNKR